MTDKEKIRALIERRRIAWLYGVSVEAKFKCEECKDILEFIDSLEVKEVDLEKEMSNYLGDDWRKDAEGKIENEMVAFAKHFFELGLKAQKGE